MRLHVAGILMGLWLRQVRKNRLEHNEFIVGRDGWNGHLPRLVDAFFIRRGFDAAATREQHEKFLQKYDLREVLEPPTPLSACPARPARPKCSNWSWEPRCSTIALWDRLGGSPCGIALWDRLVGSSCGIALWDRLGGSPIVGSPIVGSPIVGSPPPTFLSARPARPRPQSLPALQVLSLRCGLS